MRRAVLFVTLATLPCGCGTAAKNDASASASSTEETQLPSADELMAAARRAEVLEPPSPLPTSGMPAVVTDRDTRCRAGDGLACTDLEWLVTSFGITRTPERLAAELSRVACERDLIPACGRYGAALMRGIGVPQDVEAGARELERACAAGDPGGCGALGLELVYGKRVHHDPKRGFVLLVQGCDGGAVSACDALEHRPWVGRYATEVRDPDEPKPKQSAKEVAKRSCIDGRIEACDFLVQTLQFPLVDPDLCHAGLYFSCPTSDEPRRLRACREGDLRACSPMSASERGPLCALGFGGACDYDTEGDALERGCRAGAAFACRVLRNRAERAARRKQEGSPAEGPAPPTLAAVCVMGDDLACGAVEAANTDVPMSDARLARLTRACPDVEIAEEAPVVLAACRILGLAYRDGAGVTKDLGKALELLRRGCWAHQRYADEPSCVAFGDLLRAGVGVRPDGDRARLTYVSACNASESSDLTPSCALARELGVGR